MSLRKKSLSSPSPPPSPAQQQQDLKSRVISCLNRLSDRDTLALATTELESIARALTHDTFSPFLSCIHSTDDASRSPVRRQCVNILALLSSSHGDSLSPHVSKMLSIVVRRLRDPDSGVRSACIAAVTALAAKVTKPPFSSLMKPLMETLATEQDVNSQIGAAMCIAAAVEAAPDPEVELLRRTLPRVGKMVKSEAFKAKAAALGMIGSIVGVDGVVNKGLLDWLVPCLIEFLRSEDWAARKTAAEALGKIAAAAERQLAVEYKASCLKCLESRRFDKVKIARETMNRSLELWKKVPDNSEDVITCPLPSSSPTAPGNGGAGNLSPESLQEVNFAASELKKQILIKKSSPLNSLTGNSTKKEFGPKSSDKNPRTLIPSTQDQKEETDRKVERALPQSSCSKLDHQQDVKESNEVGFSVSGEGESNEETKLRTRRSLFSKMSDDKMQKFGGSKSGSRVVPLNGYVDCNSSAVIRDEEEDLTLIQKQLQQIESQQSNLFDLLQRFMGSSQSGMNSLETRVHGLEMAIEEISYDYALVNGRFPKMDSADNTCCKLPGVEFLSSKFWRRAEGRAMVSMSYDGNIKNAIEEVCELGGEQLSNQCEVSSSMNEVAGVQRDPVGAFDSNSNNISRRMIQDTGRVQVQKFNGLNGSRGSFRALGNLSSRLSA